jgi:hypothetical protein
MKFSVIDGVAPSLPHIAMLERRHRGFGEPRGCSGQRVAVVVDLAVVVEHDQPLGKVTGQHEFDRVVEEIDTRQDGNGLGLCGDRPQLCDGCAGLKGNGNRAGA